MPASTRYYSARLEIGGHFTPNRDTERKTECLGPWSSSSLEPRFASYILEHTIETRKFECFSTQRQDIQLYRVFRLIQTFDPFSGKWNPTGQITEHSLSFNLLISARVYIHHASFSVKSLKVICLYSVHGWNTRVLAVQLLLGTVEVSGSGKGAPKHSLIRK
jgi:hypothetical protein